MRQSPLPVGTSLAASIDEKRAVKLAAVRWAGWIWRAERGWESPGAAVATPWCRMPLCWPRRVGEISQTERGEISASERIRGIKESQSGDSVDVTCSP